MVLLFKRTTSTGNGRSKPARTKHLEHTRYIYSRGDSDKYLPRFSIPSRTFVGRLGSAMQLLDRSSAMIDPLTCVRYTLNEDINSTCQKLITWLSDSYPEIFLIHQVSQIDHNRVLTKLTLIHRHWGPTVKMEIIPTDSTHTLILIAAPPDPGLEDVSSYETKILENLPDASASIRLALLDGNDQKALSLIRNVLREHRHHCWMHIHSGLIRLLRLELFEGDPEELIRNIPTDNRDIDHVKYIPSQDESLLL